MDIRQWVLITELSPVTVWMFKSAYIRFSASAFNIDALEDRWVASPFKVIVHVCVRECACV